MILPNTSKTPRGCLGGRGCSQRAKRLGPTIYHLCKTIDAINIVVYYVGELASASHPREALISYPTGSAPLAAFALYFERSFQILESLCGFQACKLGIEYWLTTWAVLCEVWSCLAMVGSWHQNKHGFRDELLHSSMRTTNNEYFRMKNKGD